MSDGDNVEIIPNGGVHGNGWDAPLGRWTFDYEPAMRVVLDHTHGRTLNACAGKTKVPHDNIVRNDINPNREADTHYDVCEISDHFERNSFHTIIFDPPFDQSQAEDKYDGMHATDIHKSFECFNELVKTDGTVITFGWNSWGMSSYDSFDREKTYLLQRGPTLQDVIVSIDRRVNMSMSDF